MEEEDVECSEGEGTELLMECDEEEQEVWPQPDQRGDEEEQEVWPQPDQRGDEEEQEVWPQPDQRGDEEQQEVWPQPDQRGDEEVSCEDEEHKMKAGGVRVVPIPALPSVGPTDTMKSTDCPLGFTVNGRVLPRSAGGGGTQLHIHSHPPGSSSGFTSVHVPITVTVQSPTGSRTITTTACLTSTALPISADHTPTAPPTSADHTPVITGVVSGSAAQKVLSSAHTLNVTTSKSPPPASMTASQATPPSPMTATHATPPASTTSPQATPPSSKKRKKALIIKGAQQLRKGELGPVYPVDCSSCQSQYKIIPELRGFMCMCSPIIALSLKTLKKKNPYKTKTRSKDKHKGTKARTTPTTKKMMSPVQKTRISTDDFLPDGVSRSSTPALTSSPTPPHRVLPVSPSECPQGKLVIKMEDFYYGSAPGHSMTNVHLVGRKFAGPYRCIYCPLTLHNNIKLMCHMTQHLDVMCGEKGRNSTSSCPHCLRNFSSRIRMLAHLQTVHTHHQSTAQCRICELEFGHEGALLLHMKTTHSPGEMPYICQVCEFRSSFYSDVWCHFEETHADTKHLLCQFCLRVQSSSTYYQQHYAKHLKKQSFSCDKCRLQFQFIKERIEHKMLHHKTHIKPLQLRGLKTGTKVTVRTFSAFRKLEAEELPQVTAPPHQVVSGNTAPPTATPTTEEPKRKLAESLEQWLSNLSQDCETNCVPTRSQLCIECMSMVQDFSAHFPSMVKCSLCRFVTCCSTSYANHMINNHSLSRKSPVYQSIFSSSPRCGHMTCVSCMFSTNIGDVMANHLTERPQHQCVLHTLTRSAVNRRERIHTCLSKNRGSFVPIEKIPSSRSSAHLSVTPFTRLSCLHSEPAMTIRVLGPRPPPPQSASLCPPPCCEKPLSANQLSAVLFSLCNGSSQAARRFGLSAALIEAWTRRQESQLVERAWKWRTSAAAKWVLTQREQQRAVSEETLLQTARRALGEDSPPISRYRWAVDFMLRHDLGVRVVNDKDRRRRQPKELAEVCRNIIISLGTQVKSRGLPPQSLACLDELSIFMDSDGLSSLDPEALCLSAPAECTPLFDILLSALADGTLLNPLLFYRGSAVYIPQDFPQNVYVYAQEDGFTDEQRLHTWINQVWCPQVSSPPHSESLLLLDVHRGHLTDSIRDSLQTSHTQPVFIPAGCSCRLQPLDVCLTPVLKDFLQVRWTQLLSAGVDVLSLDQFALTLGCWLSEVCSLLNSHKDIIRRSFLSVCSLQQSGNDEVERLVKGLSDALIQTVEVTEDPSPPEEQLQIVLLMENQGDQQENHEDHENQQEEEELSPGSPSAVRQVFEAVSSPESFLGFDNTEVPLGSTDCSSGIH